jgi:hypothetical protein
MIRNAIQRAALGAFLLAALGTQASAGVVQLGAAQHHSPSLGVVASSCTLHAHCVPQSNWIPAHNELVRQEVWIPAKQTQVWVAPIFEQHCNFFGGTYRVQVGGGYFQTHCEPRSKQVIVKNISVPGHWEQSCLAIAAPPITIFKGHSKKGSTFQGYGPKVYGKKHKIKGYGG